MKSSHLLLITIILLTGCGTSSLTPTLTLAPTTETPNTLPASTDHTRLIRVKAGETFDLVVPSNSSTGYQWKILPELDVNIVEFVAQDYISQQPVMPGSGGVDVWTFRALHPGDTTIGLGYYPPSNATDPDEIVTFSVHVE